MTAWVKRGTREEVGIITDFTDDKSISFYHSKSIVFDHPSLRLTQFNMKLVEEYLDIPYTLTKCGYACSDQYAHPYTLLTPA